jgi:pimeloyl-ACP methyl ester carboxylesterase
MVRPAALTPSPLRHDVRADTTSAPRMGVVEVNGAFLSYEAQGSGQPVVFVHGALSDLRVWDPVRNELVRRAEIARRFRLIAYTQRYYGTRQWSDDGARFSLAVHADDLATLIATLAAEPVHLVGTSYGGLVAATAAVKNPGMVRSLILYEPALASLLPQESEVGRAARADRAAFMAPVMSALRAGDTIRAARAMYEAVNQLPPGGFDHEPHVVQARVLDNARTLPLLLPALSASDMTCEPLKDFFRPTLVMRGERSQAYYVLINEAIGRCMPRARQVVLNNANHGAPYHDPKAFVAAVFEFLSKGWFDGASRSVLRDPERRTS